MTNITTTITRKIEIRPVYKYNPETATQEEIKKEKKEVWDRIRTINSWSVKIANRVATECWVTWFPYANMKKREFPKIDPYKIFSEKMCVEFPELKKLKISNIATGIVKEVKDKIFTEFYDIVNSKKSLPSYKTGLPMYIPRTKGADKTGGAGLGKLIKEENVDYAFSCPLGRMKLFFGRDRSNNKSVIDNCRTGEYSLCDSAIQYDKKRNKLFLLASIKIPVDNKIKLDGDKYIGVDLGIKIPIVASIYGSKQYKSKEGMTLKEKIFIGNISEFLKERTKLQSQRKTLQRLLTNSHSGHGRKRKMTALDNLRKKESNWVKTKNHVYSKQLIDYALKNNCGNIILEDLKGFNDDKKNQLFIGRNWSYFELQTMIENKAKKYGIKVHKVDPKYTSKGCSNCGCVHDDNRISQSEFECVECGFKMNADLNASQNIVGKYLKVFDFTKKDAILAEI